MPAIQETQNGVTKELAIMCWQNLHMEVSLHLYMQVLENDEKGGQPPSIGRWLGHSPRKLEACVPGLLNPEWV